MGTDKIPVRPNPKGSPQHDHILRAKINNSSIMQLEQLLGDRHAEGEDFKMSAEWYLVTDHGSVTIHDWWALNEGEFQILASNNRAALITVEWFRAHGVQAYMLQGEL